MLAMNRSLGDTLQFAGVLVEDPTHAWSSHSLASSYEPTNQRYKSARV